MAGFHTTRWSLIAAAARDGSVAAARQALAGLCEHYWPPVYAFIRRQGRDADAARDLTQEFFARLLEKHGLAGADPNRGRFRSYLLGAVRHFLANEHDRATAAKRGGGRLTLPLDDAERYCVSTEQTPEAAFDRRWALTLLENTLAGLRAEYQSAGTGLLFEQLAGSLTGESTGYAAIAADLGMTDGAVKVAAHRLRQRYRDRLRAAIADTVASPDEVDDEIRALFAAVGQG